MGGEYTPLGDCDERFDHASYQVGLVELPGDGISTAHGGGGNWEWNVYGGEWHLMAGEAPTRSAARSEAKGYIRENADEAMLFLMGRGR